MMFGTSPEGARPPAMIAAYQPAMNPPVSAIATGVVRHFQVGLPGITSVGCAPAGPRERRLRAIAVSPVCPPRCEDRACVAYRRSAVGGRGRYLTPNPLSEAERGRSVGERYQIASVAGDGRGRNNGGPNQLTRCLGESARTARPRRRT